RQARWTQFDLERRLWMIPAAVTKTGKKTGNDFVVPLSDRAVELLQSLPRDCELVFPGKGQGEIADATLLKLVKGRGTVHGFRSGFSDWAHDKTTFDHETIEHALNHSISDKVAAAYRRGTGLEKRALLMQAWDNYCLNRAEKNNVTELKRA